MERKTLRRFSYCDDPLDLGWKVVFIFQRVVVGDGWRAGEGSLCPGWSEHRSKRGGLLLPLLHWGQDVEQGRGRIVRTMLVTVCRQATAAVPRVVTLLLTMGEVVVLARDHKDKVEALQKDGSVMVNFQGLWEVWEQRER